MIAKQCAGICQIWIHYLQVSTYAYYNFESPTLDRLSLFQLPFWWPPKVLIKLETNPQEGRSGSSG